MKRPDPERDEAFVRLYRQHRPEIIRYLIRQGADVDEAEDLAQTAFLHAYGAYAAGKEPDEPRPWLYAVARNTHRRRLRSLSARIRRVPIEPDLPEPERDPLLPQELVRALAELPENQRAALVQRELLGLDYAEIAQRLGVTVASVQMLLFRARTTLRRRRFGVALLTPVQQLAGLGSEAWSWAQRVGPAESTAGVLAAALVGAAAATSGAPPPRPSAAPAPAAPVALLRTVAATPRPSAGRRATAAPASQPLFAPARPLAAPARAPVQARALPPTPVQARALPPAPAQTQPETQERTAAPGPTAERFSPPAQPAPVEDPGAPAAPAPVAVVDQTGTTTSPLQVAVPVLTADVPDPPVPAAPSLPSTPPSLPAVPPISVPSLPVPAPTTSTTPQSPLP